MKKMIKLDMDEYFLPEYTQQEKEARIYALAKKMNIKIGRKYEQDREKNNRQDN